MRMNYGNKTMIMLHVTRTVFPRSRTRTTARYAETGYSSRPCRTDESIAERCRFVSLTASLTPLTQWPQSRCVVVRRHRNSFRNISRQLGWWVNCAGLPCRVATTRFSEMWVSAAVAPLKMTTIWHEAGAPSPISCVCVCVSRLFAILSTNWCIRLLLNCRNNAASIEERSLLNDCTSTINWSATLSASAPLYNEYRSFFERPKWKILFLTI